MKKGVSMVYKKKAALLSLLVAILALVYILSLVLDPERQRGRAFAFLDGKLLDLADRMEIYGPGGTAILNRRNNVWVFQAGALEYPVKQGRVNDFLFALSRKDLYPLRTASTGARESLGLVEGSSVSERRGSRVIVRGGAGLPLLDLLIGRGDALGREVYLARAGGKEIYSGEDRFTLYTDSVPQSWYDLRLFSEGINVTVVQQADITLPGNETKSYTLRRHRTEGSGSGWIIAGNESAALDSLRVDSWLRSVLEAEADDFGAEAPASVEGSITLRLGDGTSRVIQTYPETDEEGRRLVTLTDSPFVYVLSERVFMRLFRESGYFLK